VPEEQLLSVVMERWRMDKLIPTGEEGLFDKRCEQDISVGEEL
jgi:hypothetical protein